MLTLLRKKAQAYAGRHSNDHRAPAGTECVACDRTEPGTNDLPVLLVRCTVCAAWMCSGSCFSLHRAPAEFYAEDTRASWWKRVIGRG
jgi:hypothetical protein